MGGREQIIESRSRYNTGNGFLEVWIKDSDGNEYPDAYKTPTGNIALKFKVDGKEFICTGENFAATVVQAGEEGYANDLVRRYNDMAANKVSAAQEVRKFYGRDKIGSSDYYSMAAKDATNGLNVGTMQEKEVNLSSQQDIINYIQSGAIHRGAILTCDVEGSKEKVQYMYTGLDSKGKPTFSCAGTKDYNVTDVSISDLPIKGASAVLDPTEAYTNAFKKKVKGLHKVNIDEVKRFMHIDGKPEYAFSGDATTKTKYKEAAERLGITLDQWLENRFKGSYNRDNKSIKNVLKKAGYGNYALFDEENINLSQTINRDGQNARDLESQRSSMAEAAAGRSNEPKKEKAATNTSTENKQQQMLIAQNRRAGRQG